jgi:hypothetical protein
MAAVVRGKSRLDHLCPDLNAVACRSQLGRKPQCTIGSSKQTGRPMAMKLPKYRIIIVAEKEDGII